MLPMCFVRLRASGASVWREHKVYENHTRCPDEIQDFLYFRNCRAISGNYTGFG